MRPLWSRLLHDSITSTRAALFSSTANIALIFVPLGIAAKFLQWGDVWIFVFNFFAIFSLASVLSYATDELSAKVGQTIGGLLNATFGNMVELLVGLSALRSGEISVVQSSMVGSILSGNLLILGGCFIAGGYNKQAMSFNQEVTQLMSSLMVVASAYLIVPSVLYSTSGTENSGGIRDGVQFLSVITSLILLLFYILFLVLQLYTHRDLFKEEEHDGEHMLGIASSGFFLLLTSIGVNFCSDYLVDSIDGVVETLHISRAFIGLIIVPIVGNAGELATAVSASFNDKLDLAIGVIVGSTLQIALFVTPFMVVAGWFMDQPMTLKFDLFETTVFSLSVIVVNYLIQNGRTNYFAGALLVGTYIIIAIAFFVQPDAVSNRMSLS